MGRRFLGDVSLFLCAPTDSPSKKTNEYHVRILAKLEQKCVYLEVLNNTKSD